MNAISTGCRVRLPLGRAHPVLESARKRVGKFRTLLERELEETGGTVGAREACYVHSACTHAMLIELWTRRLRSKMDELTTEQLINISSVISREVDRRDAAVEKLGLDRREVDPFAGLYGPVVPLLPGNGSEVEGNGQEATAGHGGDAAGDSGDGPASEGKRGRQERAGS